MTTRALGLILGAAAALLLLGAGAPARAELRPVTRELVLNESGHCEQALPAVAFGAGGEALLAWSAEGQVRARLLSPDGELVGGELALGREPAGEAWAYPLHVIGADDGAFVVLWSERATAAGGRLLWRRFDPAGRPIGEEIVIAVPGVPEGILPLAGIAELPSGDLVLAWADRLGSEPVIRVQRFGPDGAAREGRQAFLAPLGWIDVNVGDDGGFLVSWWWTGSSVPAGHRAFGPDGAPLAPVHALEPQGRASAAAPLPGGGYLVVWREAAPEYRILVQRLDPAGSPLGSPRAIGSSWVVTGQGPVLARSGEVFLAAWVRAADPEESGAPPLVARELDRRGRPLGPPRRVESPAEDLPLRIAYGGKGFRSFPTLAAAPDGRFAVAWHVNLGGTYPSAKCYFGKAVVARLFEDAEGLGAPPPGGFVEAADLPGYEIQVRFGGEAAAIEGRLETDCLAEAACFSGAVPGRTEIVVRVVGPKPNGRLWPFVLRLSTSEVEVWVRQVGGTVVRYHRLPAVSRASPMLPGRYDRQGFPP